MKELCRLGERMSTVTAKPLQRSPIVMNIYGRANNQVLEADQHNLQLNLSSHQVVSYSIQRSVAGASGTHVFISDADTTDKIEEQMFNTLGGGALPHPSGNISIWEPRQDNPLLLEKQLFFRSDVMSLRPGTRYQIWTNSAAKN